MVTVSETWLDASIESSVLAKDRFNLYRLDRLRHGLTWLKKGGGLAAFVHIDCNSDPVKYANLNMCNEHIEVQIIL